MMQSFSSWMRLVSCLRTETRTACLAGAGWLGSMFRGTALFAMVLFLQAWCYVAAGCRSAGCSAFVFGTKFDGRPRVQRSPICLCCNCWHHLRTSDRNDVASLPHSPELPARTRHTVQQEGIRSRLYRSTQISGRPALVSGPAVAQQQHGCDADFSSRRQDRFRLIRGSQTHTELLHMIYVTA
jgi:hypothetical protein